MLTLTELSTCTLTLTRQGLYGSLEVAWQSGYLEGEQPVGFELGIITPASGTVTIPHGTAEKNFTVQVCTLKRHL